MLYTQLFYISNWRVWLAGWQGNMFILIGPFICKRKHICFCCHHQTTNLDQEYPSNWHVSPIECSICWLVWWSWVACCLCVLYSCWCCLRRQWCREVERKKRSNREYTLRVICLSILVHDDPLSFFRVSLLWVVSISINQFICILIMCVAVSTLWWTQMFDMTTSKHSRA